MTGAVFYGPEGRGKVMSKSLSPVSVLILLVPILLTGCGGADAQPKPGDRPGQEPLIVEAVLRYGIHQFSPGAESGLCVGVSEGGTPTDPAPSIMRRLVDTKAHPQSACKGRNTLIVGQVDWLRDDEVRVMTSYLQSSQGEKRLAYRVIREDDHWVCVGPILLLDPL